MAQAVQQPAGTSRSSKQAAPSEQPSSNIIDFTTPDGINVTIERGESGSSSCRVSATATFPFIRANAWYAAILDVCNYCRFVPHCVESALLSSDAQPDGGILKVYQKIQAPLVKGWDSTIVMSHGQLKDNTFFASWSVADDQGPLTRCTRLQCNSGTWLLKPLPGDTGVEVHYSLFTDLGNLPRIISDNANKVVTPNVRYIKLLPAYLLLS